MQPENVHSCISMGGLPLSGFTHGGFYCTIFITVVNWYFSEYYSFVYIHGLSVNDQQLYLQNHMDVLYENVCYFNSLTWVSVVKCDWDCNSYRYLGFVVTQEVTKPPAF